MKKLENPMDRAIRRMKESIESVGMPLADVLNWTDERWDHMERLLSAPGLREEFTEKEKK